MNTDDFTKAQGHWILAKMGKRVLRPGGKELTNKLVNALQISSTDEVIEFAPGMGYTASLVIDKHPKSYIGVDADEDVVRILKEKFARNGVRFTLGSAEKTYIESDSQDKVYGEAMLTMHADHRKSEIIKEAHRILKKGGIYAIHELGLMDVDESLKATIQRDLALSIKVNARPLTETEWRELLEREGFKIKSAFINDMKLLELGRLIDDEGLVRTLKISLNIMLNPKARQRILEMRKIFRKHQQHINAIAIIAEKL